MSIPPLRRPKNVQIEEKRIDVIINEKVQLPKVVEISNVIITLKDKRKLVISSDAYHGILMTKEMYKCVFCNKEIKLDGNCKEVHKKSSKHIRVLETYPHIDDFSENLMRQINLENYYCTICNVMVSQTFIRRHSQAEAHCDGLKKALMKAHYYKPMQTTEKL